MKKISLFLLVCSFSFSALANTSQNLSIYIWKDKNGVTQYSDKPPKNEKAEIRDISLEEKKIADSTIKKVETYDKPVDKENEEEQKLACETAKNNLSMLKDETMSVLTPDPKEKTGKRTMTTEERKQEIVKAEAQIVAFCNN